MNEYITKEGEQWDVAALNIYGDEKYTSFLMQANPRYIDIFEFDAGVVLIAPELPRAVSEDIPFWRNNNE